MSEYNYDNAEYCLIGSMMLRQHLIDQVSESDFQREDSQLILRMLKACRQKYGSTSAEILTEFALAETGMDLGKTIKGFEIMGSEDPATDRLKISMLQDRAQKLSLDRLINSLARETDDKIKIEAIRNFSQSSHKHAVTQISKPKEMLLRVVESLEELRDKKGILGTPTRFSTLDSITGGLRDTDLYTIAARPAIGKTAFACNLAVNIPGTAFVSTEQPEGQIVSRMLGIKGKIASTKMRNPSKFEDEDWPKLTTASGELMDHLFMIFDAPAPTVEEIFSWCIKAVDTGAKLIIVDYIQRIKATDKRMQSYERISHTAGMLKEMARTLKVPVVALAQINRTGANDPRMEHLKGSGAIEEESDMVAILNRDVDNNPTSASLNIDKNRHGPITDIPLKMELETMTFYEMTNEYDY